MKDFLKIQNILETEGEVKTKTLKELGFSTYDIKQFMESNLLIRLTRGVYTLPKEKIQEEIKSQDEVKIKELAREGTYNLSKGFYYEAEKSFAKILETDSSHSYANKALAMISASKSEFEKTYELLMTSYENIENEYYKANYYILLLMLSKVIDIPADTINEIRENAYAVLSPQESHYYKYFQKIVYNLKNDDLEKAHTVIYYLLKNDRLKRKYNFDNNFMYLLLKKVIEKLNSLKENIEPIEQNLQPNNENTVIVPSIDEVQIMNNTIILNYINSGDYEGARNFLKENSVSNQDEIIDSLLSKLILTASAIFPPTPQKVTKSEPVILIDKVSLDQEVNAETSQHTKKKGIATKKSESPKESTTVLEEKKVEETIAKHYEDYKSYYEACQFEEARRSLIRYEMCFKQSGRCRNINYHYQRLERDKSDYDRNPEKYKEYIELKGQLTILMANKKFEEAIIIAEKMIKCNLHNCFAEITLAKIYNQLGQSDKAYGLLYPLVNICEEPSFFTQLSNAAFNLGNYKEALEYCIKYNERRPHSSAANYVLMAKCYNRLRKYSKELKALLIADEINKNNGNNIDLSPAINKATNSANRNHDFVLAKINKKNVDFD